MRLTLADDAVVIRQGIARLLEERGFTIVAQADDAESLLKAVRADPPQVAVIDIRMPPTFTDEGLRAAQAIRRSHPRVGVVVLSQYIDVPYALRLLAGAEERCGYLLKDRVTDVDAFARHLRHVGAGGTVVDAELVRELSDARRARDSRELLSAREWEVLGLVAEGKSDRGIAEALVLSQKTVESHVRNVFRKLGLPAAPSENRRVHAVLRFLSAR